AVSSAPPPGCARCAPGRTRHRAGRRSGRLPRPDHATRKELTLKRALAVVAVAAVALVAAASAFAHAHISPPVALAKVGQLFSLDVPTEKEGVTTTKIMLTVPSGFSIDSFVAAPGWKRQ